MSNRADPARMEVLRARIWAMERRAAPCAAVVPVAEAVDAVLPWGGLPRGCVHDIVAEDGAAAGFCALLAGRLAREGGAVLGCLPKGRADLPYAPGLAAFALPVARLTVVHCGDRKQLLWAMEESLRCPDVAVVIGEMSSGLDLIAARRLQLAAEAGGATGLVLLPRANRPSGAATTRWRIACRPSRPEPWGGPGHPCWTLTLERCRGALPRAWRARWSNGDKTLLAEPISE